jgi:hypothetical protein
LFHADALPAQVFPQQGEQHRVLPLAELQVRLPLHPFPDVPAPLGVADRTRVEAVDLQLDPVEVEVEEQEALKGASGLHPHATAAKARLDREPARFGDPIALVDRAEGDAAGPLAVRFDDEPPEDGRLPPRALDVGRDVLPRASGPPEKLLSVVPGDEREQEVDVGRLGAAQSSRISISAAGERSRTPTLMKR